MNALIEKPLPNLLFVMTIMFCKFFYDMDKRIWGSGMRTMRSTISRQMELQPCDRHLGEQTNEQISCRYSLTNKLVYRYACLDII